MEGRPETENCVGGGAEEGRVGIQCITEEGR